MMFIFSELWRASIGQLSAQPVQIVKVAISDPDLAAAARRMLDRNGKTDRGGQVAFQHPRVRILLLAPAIAAPLAALEADIEIAASNATFVKDVGVDKAVRDLWPALEVTVDTSIGSRSAHIEMDAAYDPGNQLLRA